MSEIDIAQPISPVSEQGSVESGGSMLRQARESAGLSVSALAALLKVSTAKVEALESNRWDLLPDIVFARALTSSVCRALQIDATPILSRLPSLAALSMKTDQSGINAPFRASGEGVGLTWLSQLRKPGVLGVLVLLVAAVALFMMPSDFLRSKLAGPLIGIGDIETISIPVALTEAVSDSVDQTVNPSDAGTQLPDVSQATPEDSPIAGAPKESSASPLPITVDGNGAVAGTVVFKASGASWVEVVDGRGIVQVRKVMAEGEVLGASGEGPLSIVIGRADDVAVEVRGKRFNLESLTKNNIARFEVK